MSRYKRGKDQICEALVAYGFMTEGEANAANVWKAGPYDYRGPGWLVQRFGQSDIWNLGNSINAALVYLSDEADARDLKRQAD